MSEKSNKLIDDVIFLAHSFSEDPHPLFLKNSPTSANIDLIEIFFK